MRDAGLSVERARELTGAATGTVLKSNESRTPLSECVKSNILTSCTQPEWAMAAAGFFRLYSPPQSCPQTTFPRTEVQGPAIEAGHLDLLPPKSFPEEKKEKKTKSQRGKEAKREKERKTPKRQETLPTPHPVLETAHGLSLSNSLAGGPGPPSSPSNCQSVR